MSELRVGDSFMWSSGFGPCVAVCAYGTTESGQDRMAFWHVDATQGEGEDVVREIMGSLGQGIDEEIVENSISIAAVQGRDESSQFDEIEALEASPYPVDATAVPEAPELPEDDDWWDVEVYMNEDETVEFSTPRPQDYPDPEPVGDQAVAEAAPQNAGQDQHDGDGQPE